MKFPTRHGTGLDETGKYARGTVAPTDRDIRTLEVSEESPKKGWPHEEIRSVPFDERNPKTAFKIETTLGSEHEAMLIRVLTEYRGVLSDCPSKGECIFMPPERSEEEEGGQGGEERILNSFEDLSRECVPGD
ncbi:hypothetical protein LIER_16101 [Lithospermum erythrorhizon]|uniref:Uncharacterized protein n=1 Tax=Lithospermum erythrorhizon TaxID=34254 RepID=A0AAV3Q7Y4_LITER